MSRYELIQSNNKGNHICGHVIYSARNKINGLLWELCNNKFSIEFIYDNPLNNNVTKITIHTLTFDHTIEKLIGE
jgi:hypothetical protein